MGRLKVAVRVLDAFCTCAEPCLEDVIALREMAESPKKSAFGSANWLAPVINGERAKYVAAGLTLPRFAP